MGNLSKVTGIAGFSRSLIHENAGILKLYVLA